MAYSFGGRVRYSECDGSGRLSTFALVNYFQDCSVFHTEHIGHGVRYLQERGMAWFLSSWNIELGEMPSLGDEIVVRTWCYGIKHLVATRAFELATPAGEVLARADSQWFMFDFASGQPIRVPAEEQEPFMDDLGEKPDMASVGRRIRIEGQGEAREAIVVSRHLLDSNNHMNNAHYIDIAQAAAGMTDIARVQVQYRRAATEGDIVLPHVYACEGGVDVRLGSDDEGDDYALVRLIAR